MEKPKIGKLDQKWVRWKISQDWNARTGEQGKRNEDRKYDLKKAMALVNERGLSRVAILGVGAYNLFLGAGSSVVVHWI